MAVSFQGVKGIVNDLLMKLLSFCGGMVSRVLRSLLAFTECWMCSVGPVGLSIDVSVSPCLIGLGLM